MRSPLAVVCHDAGAANIIFAWLRQWRAGTYRVFAEGPAAQLWTRQFPRAALEADVESALDGAEVLLSGTGWASDLEHRARRLAGRRQIESIAVLDHWVNYESRFVRNGERVLPDELWVADEIALDLARQTFPGRRVTLQPNYYVSDQLALIGAAPVADPPEVLYLLEPARDNWGRDTAGEFQALDYLVAHMAAAGIPENAVLRLRPHPADSPDKYDDWIQRRRGCKASLDDAPDLATAIARSTWVAGCETSALVVALLAGRKVICTLPPWAPACRLPHAGLAHLKKLAGGTP